jgi:hypothetical protein
MNSDINNFDLPIKNPFQKSGETKQHFIKRCNWSMASIKSEVKKLFGSGSMYRNKNQERSHAKNARKHPVRIN